MQFTTLALVATATLAAALPQGQTPNQVKATAPAPSSGGGSCNFISCVTALGAGGAKCVDFAFGGSGRDCVKGVLDDIEHMPQACSDCLNALFLS